jgi:flagellar motor switch protein FliN/FliY
LLQWPLGDGEEDGGGVAALDDMAVDLTVVLGRNSMPVHMLLRMGRGAVIELEATETDMVDILANGYPVARGQVVVNGSRISVEITEILKKPQLIRTPGVTIGDAAIAMLAAAEV